MLKNSPFFSGFAVDEVAKANGFYGRTLGVFEVAELPAACCRCEPQMAPRY